MAALPAATAKRPRDERLDLFRGLTMLIIFVAHLPANSWNAWIPARFGFSSGCRALRLLLRRRQRARLRQRLHPARPPARHGAHRLPDLAGLLGADRPRAGADRARRLLDRSFGLSVLAQQFRRCWPIRRRALLGLATLTWQPDYLDILPMYLVILALVPVMMLARRLHAALPFLISVGALRRSLGQGAQPARQSLERRRLVPQPFRLAAHLLHRLLHRHELAAGAAARRPALDARGRALHPRLGAAVLLGHPRALAAAQAARDLIIPASEKTDLHILRVLHFLALAYLVLSLIEPWRDRLDRGAGHLLILIGRQSLAAFLASVVLARLLGTAADMAGRSEPVVALLNLAGFALILAAALVVGWFKSAPWAGPVPSPRPSGSLIRQRPLR
jgi:hypothetical protein